jgi:Zn finger protein HypA/HybF involved in hydrogenase expression
MPAKMTHAQFVIAAKNVHGTSYSYQEQYLGSLIKLKIKCNRCKNTFLQKPVTHLQGHGCVNCNNVPRIKTNEQFIKDVKKLHGTKYRLLSAYTDCRLPIEVKCSCGKKFSIIAKNLISTHGRFIKGCPTCSSKRLQRKQKRIEDWIKSAQKVHGLHYTYLSSYENLNSKLVIRCNLCETEFKQSYNNHVNMKQGCPSCARRSRNIRLNGRFQSVIGTEERALRYLINTLNIDKSTIKLNSEVPKFKYVLKGISRTYKPDFLVNTKTIVEAKDPSSSGLNGFTFHTQPGLNMFRELIAKRNAVVSQGFNFHVIITRGTESHQLPKGWYNFTYTQYKVWWKTKVPPPGRPYKA